MEAAANAGVQTNESFLRNYNNTVKDPLLQRGTFGFGK